mmetsp:Transcript_47442/g.75421  ORF Transcript_47442/g.75421 Transcript_47442/m.75421 type:complete len:115 (+) Transcript_47442:788-1132(+)
MCRFVVRKVCIFSVRAMDFTCISMADCMANSISSRSQWVEWKITRARTTRTTCTSYKAASPSAISALCRDVFQFVSEFCGRSTLRTVCETKTANSFRLKIFSHQPGQVRTTSTD